MPTKELEKKLYPLVEEWMKKRFNCFRTEINKGIAYGRMDVLGISDIGGDFTGDVETIAIEVKRGSTPFHERCGASSRLSGLCRPLRALIWANANSADRCLIWGETFVALRILELSMQSAKNVRWFIPWKKQKLGRLNMVYVMQEN